ncbi:MAG TPA: Ig-like domain-containing protein [Gemmatimonadaceae bacterium]|nr:Ig-like domain-containing protein [Gemmatimonadaceae bacterium]
MSHGKSIAFTVVAAVVLATALGCGDSTKAPTVASVSIQPATFTFLLASETHQFAATVRGDNGQALSGVGVTWSTSDPDIATVSTTGLVTAVGAGSATISAEAGGKSGSATVSVSVSNCGGSLAPIALGVGDVRKLTPTELSDLCLDGGSGSEYVLIPYFSTLSSSSTIQLDVVGAAVKAPVGPPTPDRAPLASGGVAPRLSLGAAAPRRWLMRDDRFDVQLRQRERRELPRMVAATRAWYGAQRSGVRLDAGSTGSQTASAPARSLVTAGKSVGDAVQVNVQANFSCSNPVNITGHIKAISDHAIVVADDANPAGGFTDTQYQSFATTFDTLVYDVDTQTFGDPSDIDNNDRVVILFTKSVNELTPPNSSAFVGGFFIGRDLQATSACQGSNVAEMFYVLVPDPNGVVNGNEFAADFVESVTIGTLAHEFQHLINASRRIFVNGATVTSEEVWLNEGLSHIAEELVFYKASQLEPRQNIDRIGLAGSSQVLDAFRNLQVQNFLRMLQYISAPDVTAPYRSDGNDDLNTRGATWEFLRYAADRKATTDGTIWFDLVNSTTSGFQNFTNVFGVDIRDWVEDFTVAQYVDDAGLSVSSQFTFPSWNYRDAFLIFQNVTSFPLDVTSVSNGTHLTLSLTGGGSRYLKFAQAGAAPASVRVLSQGQPVPAQLHATLVRTK